MTGWSGMQWDRVRWGGMGWDGVQSGGVAACEEGRVGWDSLVGARC